MTFQRSILALAVSGTLAALAGCNDGDSSADTIAAGTTVPHEIASEAAPATATDVYFGGNDDADNSGSVKYLVIAESGVAFQPDAELQGLTLEAVGSGTTISHVQVLGSEDDGIEFFGGTVNVDHVVINSQDDDGLDFDDGYRGTIQYAIVRMGNNDGDRGIEADNAGPSDTAEPITAPNVAYLTILGNQGKSSKTTMGALFRRGFAGHIYRAAFVDDPDALNAGAGFEGGCFDVDDMLPAGLSLTDVVCNSTNELVADSDSYQTDFQASANYDVSTASVSVDANTLAVSGYTPSGSLPAGVDDNPYVGAVDPNATTPWWDGWTVHLANDTGSLKRVDFHPLQAEIENGTITPAADTRSCPAGTSEGEKTTVTLFGKTFPVCLLNQHLTGDVTYTLDNRHVYVLTDYIKVGNGGVQDRAKADADQTKLVIEAGTMIFADAGEKAGIRITRGAQIDVQGTAEMPVIMSAVDFDLSSGTITGDPTDFTGRGEWGGLVIDGYARTNSLDR